MSSFYEFSKRYLNHCPNVNVNNGLLFSPGETIAFTVCLVQFSMKLAKNMAWRRPEIRGHKHQQYRYRVGLLVKTLFCDKVFMKKGTLSKYRYSYRELYTRYTSHFVKLTSSDAGALPIIRQNKRLTLSTIQLL